MTCTEAKQLISLQHDGIRVSPELRDHLAVCSSCRSYRELVSSVFVSEEVHAPASLTENVMSRLEHMPSPAAIRRRRSAALWLPVTAAACAVLCISVLPRMGANAKDSAAPEMYMAGDAYRDTGVPEEEPAEAKLAEICPVAEDTAKGSDGFFYCATVTGTLPEDIPWEEWEDGSRVAYLPAEKLREWAEKGVPVICDVSPEELEDGILVKVTWIE